VEDPGTQTHTAPARKADRGRYKVFLGMAAGVGKTYRMLQEGQAEAEAGRDVVIGYLEPHDRPETAALAQGLEVVPRRRVTYRDTALEEMDLPAVLARHPELALIDELAHTNAPGVEHEKRYEDIADVLETGIDVFSTVNVQHLESLNDQVAELTGVRVRETVPDSILGTADEVVLVDLTPEALIERLRAGKVYPGQNIDAALNNFFRIENLSALREVALRQVAEEVESKRLVVTDAVVGTRQERIEADVPKAVGERILALIRPRTSSQRLVRRAWRSAQRLGTGLDVLWVKRPGERMTESKEKQLAALRRLASVLGAELLIEENDDVVEAAADVARRRGITYIFVGQSPPRRGLARLREPLPQRLMQATPAGVDVRIIADRGERAEGEEAEEET
jgi:two-component system sensor histidine kinase KdpD